LSAWTLAVVAAGSKGLGWIDVGAGSETVRVLAEATLTLVLFADVSRIDLAAPPQRWRLRAAGRERAFMRSG
jgi:hypothetical protein